MYQCSDCLRFFEEPDRVYYSQPSEFQGRRVYEHLREEECPYCASPDIEQVVMCACGNDRILDGYDRCHVCESKADRVAERERQFKTLVREIVGSKTEMP